MRRPVAAASVLVALAALSACSLDDAPLIGKPAANLDGHTISMTDYKLRLKVEDDLYHGDRTQSQKEEQAIRSLVDEQLISDEAAKKGLSVSDDEINTEIAFQRSTYAHNSQLYRQQHPTSPAPPDFNTFLRGEGYDVDKLRESVRHILLEQKVQHVQARNRADTAYRLFKAGTDIGEVARKYSDLPSGATGGQEKATSTQVATADARLQPVLNTLQPGDTSRVTEASNGFYIVKLLTRDENGITMVFVFVAAPQPQLYTPKYRPQWFQDFVKGLEDNAHVVYHVGPKAT